MEVSINPLTGKLSKYAVNSYDVNTVLAWINSGEIAIPEIQRPFVWDSSKVGELGDLDHLHRLFEPAEHAVLSA